MIVKEPELGEPGSDLSPFVPEPNTLSRVNREPERIPTPWLKAFWAEITGLILKPPRTQWPELGRTDKVIPLKESFKCKLNQDGKIDKLKCRVVFRGDLHKSNSIIDSWNPHADYTNLKIFLGLCARLGVFPRQLDFVMAYLQTKMQERVSVRMPEYLSHHLPIECHKYIGKPVLLRMALYGYTYAGKFFWEEQAAFLRKEGFISCQSAPALWHRRTDKDICLILQYSDDFAYASTSQRLLNTFEHTILQVFDAKTSPHISWFLQARIRQDQQLNIS
jgi:hypothetical protein